MAIFKSYSWHNQRLQRLTRVWEITTLLMDISTISMAIFKSYVSHYQRLQLLTVAISHQLWMAISPFFMGISISTKNCHFQGFPPSSFPTFHCPWPFAIFDGSLSRPVAAWGSWARLVPLQWCTSDRIRPRKVSSFGGFSAWSGRAKQDLEV